MAISALSPVATPAPAAEPPPEKLVIAHRGASGYLPEHTLAAYALAYGQGADYIEPDVVLSKDGVLVCNHDIHMDQTTDVAQKFPTRRRADGHYYFLDFTVAEIKTLLSKGRRDALEPGYPVATLEEMLLLVRRLNERTGRRVGTIPEPKQPAWHRQQGHAIEEPLLAMYQRFGCTRRADPVIVQCFEEESLVRMRRDAHCDLTLVFLSAAPLTDEALDRLASFADGIGPAATLIEDRGGQPIEEGSLASRARRRGLKVFPYTFGADEQAMRRFFWTYGVDGLFCDNPDAAVRARAAGPP